MNGKAPDHGFYHRTHRKKRKVYKVKRLCQRDLYKEKKEILQLIAAAEFAAEVREWG